MVSIDRTICCVQCLMRRCNYILPVCLSGRSHDLNHWILYILLVNIIKMNPREAGGHLIQDV